MARLFTSGFEINSTTSGHEFDTVSGSVSIVTTGQRSGNRALRVNPTSGTGYVEQQWDRYTQTTGTRYYRFYLKVATAPSADTIIFAERNSSNNGWNIKLTSDRKLKLYSGTTLVATSTNQLTLNQWYRIEVKGFYSTSAQSNEIRVDGTAWASGSNSQSRAVDRMRLGVLNSATCDLYFDDVAINDSNGTNQNSWAGAGSVVTLFPNAEGDVNTWSRNSGTSSYYTYIDDNPPDDATTYLYGDSTGESHLSNMQSMSDAGSGSVDSVTLVQVGGRHYNQSTLSKFRFQAKEGGSTTNGVEINTANAAFKTWYHSGSAPVDNYTDTLTMYTKPSGGAWTEAAVNSLQCGMYMTSATFSHQCRVSTVWAVVEFIPSTGTNYTKTLSEIVTMVEDRMSDTTKLANEAITIVDSKTNGTTKGAFAEVITLAESLIKNPKKTVSEAVTLVESIVKQVGKTAGETITTVDTLMRQLVAARVFSEVVLLTETLANKAGKTFAETVTIVESTIGRAIGKLAQEVVTVVDTATKATSRAFAEVVTIADTIAKKAGKTFTQVITLVDNLETIFGKVFTETITVVDSLVKKATKLAQETITVIDNYARTWTLTRVKQEVVTIADSIAKGTTRAFQESLTLIDDLITTFGKVFTEVVTVTDSITKKTSRALSEAITIVDAALKKAGKAFSEALSLVDSFVKSITYSRVFAETIAIADSIKKAATKAITEAITITDSIKKATTRTFTQAITIADTITKKTAKVFQEAISLVESLLNELNPLILSIGNWTVNSLYGLSHTVKEQAKAFVLYLTKRDHAIKETSRDETLAEKGRDYTIRNNKV